MAACSAVRLRACLHEHGCKGENAAYVCLSPQLLAILFISRGQTVTRHTNTHPLSSDPPHQPPETQSCRSDQHTSGESYCRLLCPADMQRNICNRALDLAFSSMLMLTCGTADLSTSAPLTTPPPTTKIKLFHLGFLNVLRSDI